MATKKFLVFGGGGKVARHFARLASAEGHEVIAVVRNETHSSELTSLGATPHVLSLESATVPTLISLLTKTSPDAIIFSAGAGGKGGEDRTRAVDYEGALKVFDAMESGNVKRLILVGAVDIRSREKGWPSWYDEDSKKMSDRMWGAIPAYMQAKIDAELELHSRKILQYTVVRPGGLTEEPAGGCALGQTQLGKTRSVDDRTPDQVELVGGSRSLTLSLDSRELVAKLVLACATEPRTEGLSIDVMDGQGALEAELNKVVEGKIDAWTG